MTYDDISLMETTDRQMQYYTTQTQGSQVAFHSRGKGVQQSLVGAETVKKNLGNEGWKSTGMTVSTL